ncbi:hypothetical protein PMI09_03315 [Rhizobium sp. CF122]|nr:hypothetical protein PMI09_03315 [Rhizobium sp. CF122]
MLVVELKSRILDIAGFPLSIDPDDDIVSKVKDLMNVGAKGR